MFLEEGIFGIAVLILWVYCIFDVITSDESDVQNLPKMIWLIIVLLFPPIGPLAWLLLGRPRNTSFRLRTTGPYRTPSEPLPSPGIPERRIADDDFHRKREEALQKHQAEREAELRRKEDELRKREEELRRRELGDS